MRTRQPAETMASVAEPEGTPYSHQPPSHGLAQLRLLAERCVKAEDDPALLELVEELRGDPELWPHLWAPAAAIAAHRSGRPDGLALLKEAVAAGFSQPELFEGRLESEFSEEPDWAEVQARLGTQVPNSRLRLLSWPDPPACLPLKLDRIDTARERLLRQQLPAPEPSAWDTALMLLRWVHQRWEHANDHVENPDALEVLDRVDAAERFACVEYSIVLSQALNALRVPARRVRLLQTNHHVGVGRGHVVSEAWIDDLDRWVVFDGQNGSYWADANDDPLGLLELQAAFHRDHPPATMVPVADDTDDIGAADWWTYFASAATTGYAWASPPYSPIFQSTHLISTDRLLCDGRDAYPRLCEVSIGLTGAVAEPAVTLSTSHPYAVGFAVRHDEHGAHTPLPDAELLLEKSPGMHTTEIAVVTDYGPGRSSTLRYEVH